MIKVADRKQPCAVCGSKTDNKWCKPCRDNGRHRRQYPCRQCGEPTKGPGLKYCGEECKAVYREAKRTIYPCKACGEPRPHGSVYCKECSPTKDHKPSLFFISECEVCGIVFSKMKPQSDRQTTRTCGLECQRKLALVWKWEKGKIPPQLKPFIHPVDWQERSAKAKVRAQQQQSRKRWKRRHKRAAQQLAKIRAKRSSWEHRLANPWEYAIQVRLTMARTRRRTTRIKKTAKPTSIENEIARVIQRRRWANTNPWAKKIANKLSNQNKRRRRKDVQGCRNHEKARSQRLQMCFEWMAD